jgi:antitoxin ParD1/3/4
LGGEVIREALRGSKVDPTMQLHGLAALKADIDKGLKDLSEGRVKEFDVDCVIPRVNRQLRDRRA